MSCCSSESRRDGILRFIKRRCDRPRGLIEVVTASTPDVSRRIIGSESWDRGLRYCESEAETSCRRQDRVMIGLAEVVSQEQARSPRTFGSTVISVRNLRRARPYERLQRLHEKADQSTSQKLAMRMVSRLANGSPYFLPMLHPQYLARS